MPVEVYQSALEQAKDDLIWINREFEKLSTRKKLLEGLIDVLMPFISNMKSDNEPATSPQPNDFEIQAQQEG